VTRPTGNSRAGHIPRKRFGQHFLIDHGLIDQIVRAIAPEAGEHVFEIGPGLGALTLPLLQAMQRAEQGSGDAAKPAQALTVIELDRDLVARWQKDGRVNVIGQDVLKVDFAQLAHERAAPLRVVGNLPYNISSPILFHLLDVAHLVRDQHFMLQKEVIDRMVAKPSTSDYGRLSVMLQWRYAMHNILLVPPEAFDPPPRVMSAVVRMVPRAQPAAVDVALLSELVQVAFSQRRKILRNTLGAWLDQKGFSGTFDVQRRAEEVSVDEYLAITLQVQARG
jgi:16S rRNA (adenine1518-N6/adenine1519-N6)-dimethyltransferase